MAKSKSESVSSAGQSVDGRGTDSRIQSFRYRHREGPDPAGSGEPDWEYEGRYLELEKRLREHADHVGGDRAYAQTASPAGVTWKNPKSAHRGEERGPDHETAHRFGLRGQDHYYAAEGIWEEAGKNTDRQTYHAGIGRDDWQKGEADQPGYPGHQDSQRVGGSLILRGNRKGKSARPAVRQRSRRKKTNT
ncbi:MAG: hypothetical protein JWR19_2129 [Pedosphaera sp.]|nr:hypothetical protein [Pedosphaera sp.]